MVRVVVALFVLGMGAIAWVLLLPDTPKRPPVAEVTQVAPANAPPTAAASDTKPAPAAAGHEVRVVYPGPDGTAGVRKLADKVDAEANLIAVATPVPTTPPAPVPVAAPPLAPAEAAANPEAAPAQVVASAEQPPAAPTGATVNINTASVESLNQIPGAGRIGRTIASHRPYRSVDELLSKRVVRKSVYDKIKDQIAIN